MMPSTSCDTCRGTGWEPVRIDGVNRMRRCSRCDYWERRRGVAPGVPADEATSTFDTYQDTGKNTDAITQARHFLSGVHPNLYLWGGVGVGKTRLACTILNELHRAGQRVRFFRVPELLAKLMPGSDSTDEVFDQVADIPVVVLDDVGANAGTDFSRRMLQSIYDARCDRSHRTIWTSNLDLDELAEFLGEDRRLPSRIAGTAKVVEVEGPDWRLKAARKRAGA